MSFIGFLTGFRYLAHFNSKKFLQFLVGSFSVQCGNHFFSLALSAYILLHTQSIVSASLVMVFSYVPSVLFSNYLGGVIDRHFSKDLLVKCFLGSVILTTICGALVFYHINISALCFVLSLRSLLSFMSRATLVKWLKATASEEQQTSRMKLFFLSFFLSTSLSGVLAATILLKMNIWLVVITEIALIFVGALILLPMLMPKISKLALYWCLFFL